MFHVDFAVCSQQSSSSLFSGFLNCKNFKLCLVSFEHNKKYFKSEQEKNHQLHIDFAWSWWFFHYRIYNETLARSHVRLMLSWTSVQILRKRSRDTHVELERMKMVEWSFTHKTTNDSVSNKIKTEPKWNQKLFF